MILAHQDTIVAQSTAVGNAAIGIIRLSGPGALALLDRVWQGAPTVHEFQPRHLYIGKIGHHETKTPLDQVVVFWMRAPHSYTGEDVVEVQAHGGQRLLELLIENFIHAGARMAEPGEFTKRAFLNERIDLIQAEAIADLIQATTTKAASLAQRQVEGRLSEYIRYLRNDLKVMRAQLEAMIDFPEDEDVQGLHYSEITDRTEHILSQIQKLLQTYQEGRSFREGIRVAIIGKPNAGKSSLFNALLKSDRAIVHPTPGTTRDLIEEALDLNGLMVRFMDTAGIRKGKGLIESEGIRRTLDRLYQADLILAVLDASRPTDEGDEMVLQAARSHKDLIFVLNKTDLPIRLSEAVLKEHIPKSPLISLSAKTGAGIDTLKKEIFSHFIHNDSSKEDTILTNVRHKTALEKGLQALERVKQASVEKLSLECLVADLTLAMNALGEVTGEVTHDEILGEIFSRFCLGK